MLDRLAEGTAGKTENTMTATLVRTRRVARVSQAPQIDESLPPAISAVEVRRMLVEITIVLHATKVLGREDENSEEWF